MNKKLLYWLPRIIAIIYICFLAIFALDVFGEYAFPIVLIALFMHLIPNFVLISALVLAWKKEFAGGIVWLALGVGFTLFFRSYQDIIVFMIVALPVFVVGALFLLDYYKKK